MIPLGSLLLAVLIRPAAAESWSGPYVGVNGGYAWGQTSTSFDSDGDAQGLFGRGLGTAGEGPDGGYNQYPHGFVYGGQLGWMGSLGGPVVGGLEVVYDRGNVYSQALDPLTPRVFTGSRNAAKLYVDTLASLAPRLGVGWDRFLLTGKGGLAVGRVVSRLWNSTNTGALTFSGPTTFAQDQARFGWTCGAGLDFAFAGGWILGAAFDYYDLGKIRFGGVTDQDSNLPLSYAVHPIIRTLTARLSYRFGGGKVAAPASEVKPVEAAAQPPSESVERGVATLLDSLKSGTPSESSRAAVALGDWRALDAVEPLIAELRNPSPAVRGASADALGKIGDKRAVDAVLPLLGDREPSVRALAARALGALGDPRSSKQLKNAELRDADPLVRKAAAAAVAGSKEVDPAIEELLRR